MITLTEDLPDSHSIAPDISRLRVRPFVASLDTELLQGHPLNRDPLLNSMELSRYLFRLFPLSVNSLKWVVAFRNIVPDSTV